MTDQRKIYLLALGGGLAVFIGMGLGRFGYTPILTLYASQGWLTASEANYLGVGNFLGYLLGIFIAWHVVSRTFNPVSWIKFALILTGISFLACAYNLGFLWFLLWRFIAGITCAILIITAPSVVLKKIPSVYLGRLSGVVFSGMSVGIIASGWLVPHMAVYGLATIWFAFAFITLFSSIFIFAALNLLKQLPTPTMMTKTNLAIENIKLSRKILILLGASYALAGIAFVPQTLFIGAYLASMGFTTSFIGHIWMAFGVGGVIGTFFTGYLGDKLGIHIALFLALLLASIMMFINIIFDQVFIIWCSSFILGILLPTTVTLTSAVVKVFAKDHHKGWAEVTLYFAVGQVVSAYFIAYLIDRNISFQNIFALGSIIFLVASVFVLSICFYKRYLLLGDENV